jgi:hypothetical protein
MQSADPQRRCDCVHSSIAGPSHPDHLRVRKCHGIGGYSRPPSGAVDEPRTPRPPCGQPRRTVSITRSEAQPITVTSDSAGETPGACPNIRGSSPLGIGQTITQLQSAMLVETANRQHPRAAQAAIDVMAACGRRGTAPAAIWLPAVAAGTARLLRWRCRRSSASCRSAAAGLHPAGCNRTRRTGRLAEVPAALRP